MAIDENILYSCFQTLCQLPLEFLCVSDPQLHFSRGKLSGDTHANDADEILGAGSLVILLHPTVQKRPDAGTPADV